MTQIINLLSFIKALIFNRGMKTDRRANKNSLLQTIFIAIFAVSLYGNYVLIGRIFDKTKQVVGLKNEVQELRPLAQRVIELEYANEVLRQTIILSTNGGVQSASPPSPRRAPKDPAIQPNVVPNVPPRPAPVKENTHE